MICNYDNNNNNNSDVCGGEEDDSAENIDEGNGHCGGEDIRIGVTEKEEENTIQVFFIFIICYSSSQ